MMDELNAALAGASGCRGRVDRLKAWAAANAVRKSGLSKTQSGGA